MLSTELQERLDTARALQNNYQPKAEIADQLNEKVLVMIVAPAVMGKSLLMKEAEAQAENFARVPVFTTRTARQDDEPGMFRVLEHNEENVHQILNKIEDRSAVQYMVHPTIGTFYGTELNDYPTAYNMLPTISNVVEHLRNLPFKRTVTIGLITEPQIWSRWFNERYPMNNEESNEERLKRAAEAITSLSWLLDQPDDSVIWLINNEDALPETAARLIEQASGERGSDENARTLAKACLDTSRTFI